MEKSRLPKVQSGLKVAEHLVDKKLTSLMDLVKLKLGEASYTEQRWNITIESRFVTLLNEKPDVSLAVGFTTTIMSPHKWFKGDLHKSLPSNEFKSLCEIGGWHSIIVEFVAVFSGKTTENTFKYAAVSAACAVQLDPEKWEDIYSPNVMSFTNMSEFKQKLLQTPLAIEKPTIINQLGKINNFLLPSINRKESASVEDDKGFLTLKI